MSGVVGGLAGMLAAIIYVAHGADLWLSVAFVPAGVFVGAMFWYCVPIKS